MFLEDKHLGVSYAKPPFSESGLVQCYRISEPPPCLRIAPSTDNMASVRAASRLLSKRVLSKTKAVSSNNWIPDL